MTLHRDWGQSLESWLAPPPSLLLPSLPSSSKFLFPQPSAFRLLTPQSSSHWAVCSTSLLEPHSEAGQLWSSGSLGCGSSEGWRQASSPPELLSRKPSDADILASLIPKASWGGRLGYLEVRELVSGNQILAPQYPVASPALSLITWDISLQQVT